MPRLAAFNFGARKFGFGSLFSSAAATEVNYIEDVFSTWLYTGNGSTQTITNGIDLSTKGGMVWVKDRGNNGDSHWLTDTAIGRSSYLSTNNANAALTGINPSYSITTFNSNGFSLGPVSGASVNTSAYNYASWTFRKQPKFFDVVTYTGNGTNDRAIAHSLGSTPGCYIVKATSTTSDWLVYHRGNPFALSEGLRLNGTESTNSTYSPASTTPTSTNIYVGRSGGGPTNNGNVNGVSYVAYLFAHDAGGFGLTGSDNVISCGSFTTASTSDSPIISLGYEPQLVLVKLTNTSGNWHLFDNMRGVATGGVDALLRPNLSAAEVTVSDYITFNATGFQWSPNIDLGANTYIYIAIRRGPMKVPTSGTSVFSPNFGANSANQYISTGFNPDLAIHRQTVNAVQNNFFQPRLTGQSATSQNVLWSNSTSAEVSTTDRVYFGLVSNGYNIQNARADALTYAMLRAPGFFDVVCYTGTGSVRTVTHNLGAVPQLIIIKGRDTSYYWPVYSFALGNQGALALNETSVNKGPSGSFWDSTSPTTTNFTLGSFGQGNQSSATYVAYLFATCTNVSKVGVYTGTGTTQTINCGFTGGARFVLIKRTDSTGDWYVWDTARGIIAGNDPYLLLNSTDAEVTNTDYIDPVASGFELSSTAPAAINANGGTYIFLAIA